MFWRIVGSIFVGVWIFNGFQMLGCETVVFSGGGRVTRWACVQGPAASGVPGALVGLVIIAGGIGLLWWWWGNIIQAIRGAAPVGYSPQAQSQSTTHATPKSGPQSDSRRRLERVDDIVYNYDWSERVKAARHPKTGQRTLAALAMDKIPAVRQAVAYNQNAGRTVLTELAESDSDTGVQRVALETLEAMAPDKPESERPQAVTMEELRADLSAETDPPEPGTAVTMDDLKRELRANPPAEPEAVQEPAGENIQRTLGTIERLSALRDSGAITTEEYETLKKKALD